MQGDTRNVQPFATLAKLGRAVTGANSFEVGKERTGFWQRREDFVQPLYRIEFAVVAAPATVFSFERS